MRKVYGLGTGGKHRNGQDARMWRALTSHIANNLHLTYPHMGSIALDYAEDEARRVVRALNQGELEVTLEGV